MSFYDYTFGLCSVHTTSGSGVGKGLNELIRRRPTEQESRKYQSTGHMRNRTQGTDLTPATRPAEQKSGNFFGSSNVQNRTQVTDQTPAT
jgi:hypothetical protein